MALFLSLFFLKNSTQGVNHVCVTRSPLTARPTWQKLDHPNICRLHAVYPTVEHLFMVMVSDNGGLPCRRPGDRDGREPADRSKPAAKNLRATFAMFYFLPNLPLVRFRYRCLFFVATQVYYGVVDGSRYVECVRYRTIMRYSSTPIEELSNSTPV